MSRLTRRLARLERQMAVPVSQGCHHCNGAPLVLFDDEPENTAPYSAGGRCGSCGFLPKQRLYALSERGLAGLFEGLPLSDDPLLRKLEKSMLLVAVAGKDRVAAEQIVTSLYRRHANEGEVDEELNGGPMRCQS